MAAKREKFTHSLATLAEHLPTTRGGYPVEFKAFEQDSTLLRGVVHLPNGGTITGRWYAGGHPYGGFGVAKIYGLDYQIIKSISSPAPSQPSQMKYRILLALEVEADPADLGGAARKGFNKLASKFNSGKPITLHLLPQDGSHEALLAEQILEVCFQAHSTPRL